LLLERSKTDQAERAQLAASERELEAHIQRLNQISVG